ncbi:unnamed protein product [Ectocarpus sp. 12 AP-2014]
MLRSLEQSRAMRAWTRPISIFVAGVALTGTMAFSIRKVMTTIVNTEHLGTTNEVGLSIASALRMHDRWEAFATLTSRVVELSDDYFEDLSVSFSLTYTSPVFVAERVQEAWTVQFSHPVDAGLVGKDLAEFEDAAYCVASMESSGRQRIAVYPELMHGGGGQSAPAPDFLYCTPIKTNGSINSFVGIGVFVDDLLATETSITSVVEEFDILIQVGENEDSGEGGVVIFTSGADGLNYFSTYTTDLSPNYPVSVSFSAPHLPYWWYVYVFGAVGTTASCVCALLGAKYEQKGDIAKQKSLFLASISHEIRTPMNGIIGMSDLLSLETGIPAQAVECVRVIGVCSKHLLGLINNVLDLSKIEAKQMTLSKSVISTSLFHEVVSDTWLMCRRDNGTTLTIVYENIPLDADVVGDALKITQVISNLVTNAAKFTDGGSVRVSVRWEKRHASSPDAVAVCLRVIDTGIGIPARSMEQLFKPFVQMSNNKSGKGTGIGLTISRSLAVAMGGNLTCTSRENEGSEFTFEFVVGGSFVEQEESVVIGDQQRRSRAVAHQQQ